MKVKHGDGWARTVTRIVDIKGNNRTV